MTLDEQVCALREKFGDRIIIRDCSMCGYELAYIWRDNELFYDAGCHCTGMRGGLESRDIRSLHEFLTMNPTWTERKLAS